MQLGSWIRQLRRGQCDQVVMVGKVDRAKLAHNPLAQLRERPDWRALRLWYRDLRRDPHGKPRAGLGPRVVERGD